MEYICFPFLRKGRKLNLSGPRWEEGKPRGTGGLWPPSVPPSYPGPSYQGYHTMPPQPGMPAAPYPMQYPPSYPAQPMGPAAYHETLAGGATVPYPASQPPYNPAYMNALKAAL
ncbi:hypothetical protein H8959_006419 [Pygathrix nigripes]